MLSDQILAHLEQIYTPDVAQETCQAILDMIEAARQEIDPSDQSTTFSEKDVAVITYGDSLRRAGEPPLATLNQFLEKHLQGLVSIVHILPFFPYSSDDGFSITDYEAVNPDLGDWQHIGQIADNFRLMTDLVLNHMSSQSAWFQAFLADNPDYADLFLTELPETDLSSITRPRATPLLHPFEKEDHEIVHVWTTFSQDQVDFDYHAPRTLMRMLGVLLFYVEHGASVIRLDAVGYLWKEVGTSSIHLDEAHEVVKLMRTMLDAVAPHVVIITETNVPHAENISYFGQGDDEAQMVYNFTLPPLLLHTMLTGNCGLLREWVNTLHAPSPHTTFFNFTASHDGIGLRPLEGIVDAEHVHEMALLMEHKGGRVNYKRNADGTQSPYELNITYVDAVTDADAPVEIQVKQFIVTQAIMLALAGVPAAYIHSLLGSHNDLEGVERLGHNRAINRAKLDADAIQSELADPTSFRAQVFTRYKELIAARIQCAAFHPNAAQTAVDTGNDGVLVLLRESDSGERVFALHNITGNPQTVTLPETFKGGKDLLSGNTVRQRTVTLEPFAVCWLLETQ